MLKRFQRHPVLIVVICKNRYITRLTCRELSSGVHLRKKWAIDEKDRERKKFECSVT